MSSELIPWIAPKSKFLGHQSASDTSIVSSCPHPIPTNWFEDPGVLLSIISREENFVGAPDFVYLSDGLSSFVNSISLSYPRTLFEAKIEKGRWKGVIPVLPTPQSCYEASCFLEAYSGPYRGYQLEVLSPIWPFEPISSNTSYYLVSRGGVLLPWLPPIAVDTPLVQIALEPIYFDGLVARRHFVPGCPVPPSLPVSPTKFLLAPPPPQNPIDVFLYRFGYRGGSTRVHRRTTQESIFLRRSRRMLQLAPWVLLGPSMIIDQMQNSFHVADIRYFFVRPSIPPSA